MQRALPPPLLTPPSPVSLLLRKKAVCFFLGGSRSKGSLEEEAAVGGREEDAWCLGIALLELAERKGAGESWAAFDTAGARSGCMSVICVSARSCVAVRQRWIELCDAACDDFQGCWPGM